MEARINPAPCACPTSLHPLLTCPIFQFLPFHRVPAVPIRHFLPCSTLTPHRSAPILLSRIHSPSHLYPGSRCTSVNAPLTLALSRTGVRYGGLNSCPWRAYAFVRERGHFLFRFAPTANLCPYYCPKTDGFDGHISQGSNRETAVSAHVSFLSSWRLHNNFCVEFLHWTSTRADIPCAVLFTHPFHRRSVIVTEACVALSSCYLHI
ncbi:hypothetical protein EXIGLDRAFT_298180 [Exidia glandulosa HHB12029]|uniref:Uncharacterized protein n=1 Tax=Exidia glandulosa HHB12029 TaxID=1314781 RepID=A0A165LZ15_EXIGL|nr:hypothetical protein EXIGLDRAFT_298180 [Exidia glandulosa HHB12029]